MFIYLRKRFRFVFLADLPYIIFIINKKRSIMTSINKELRLSWTDSIQVRGAFGSRTQYSFGTSLDREKPEVFRKVFGNLKLPKKTFKKRTMELENFNHENYVKVRHEPSKVIKIKDQQFITDFTVFSPYVQSIPVSTIISNFIALIEQMVNLMTKAEAQAIHHFRLNPDSLLLTQNQELSHEYFLKVCDWGYQNQLCSRESYKRLEDYLQKISQNSMFEYMHPELLFQKNSLGLYQKYQSKYDIWSFGIILYRMAFIKRPFERNGSYSPETLFEYYNGKRSLEIKTNSLLATLIAKTLSLKGFMKWSQIKDFLILKAERVESDFVDINTLYNDHQYLINYMVQIYQLTAWNINNSANTFWFQNKNAMKKFLFHLLKFIFCLHNKKFVERFGHRMTELSQNQKQQFFKLAELIGQEFEQKEKKSKEVESTIFFQIFQKLTESLVPIQLRVEDSNRGEVEQQGSKIGARVRQSWKSIRVIKEFSNKIIVARNKIQNRNKYIFQNLFEIMTHKS